MLLWPQINNIANSMRLFDYPVTCMKKNNEKKKENDWDIGFAALFCQYRVFPCIFKHSF